MRRESGRAKDVRFRPFRAAAYALHLLVIFAFTGLVLASVVRSVVAMTPGHRRSSEPTLSVADCAAQAESYWRELDAHRRELTAKTHVRRADADWSRFRLDWLQRLRLAETRCAVDARARSPLKEVFQRLERLMDLYTTHAVQFAGEVGGSVDGFYRALEAARGSSALPGG